MRLQDEIMTFLEYKENIGEEESAVLKWLKHNKLFVFPYDYIRKYHSSNVKIYNDYNCACKYVFYQGKRLYLKDTMTEDDAKMYVNSLLLEQDEASPHFYFEKDDGPKDGSIVADLGAAEGIYALSVIEKVKKVYLFECDAGWIKALRLTFAPWKDKVVIVNRFIGAEDDERCVTLDTYFQNKKIDYIKADIEGAEVSMLIGGENTFKNKVTGAAICAYHRADDEEQIREKLIQFGFQVRHSAGYMIFVYDEKLCAPYLRRGLVFGIK